MKEYYAKLPRKRMGAGVLLFNRKHELLLVKPNYKDYWNTPGGTVDKDESPREACIREVKEEIGLKLTKLDFLCVDYLPDINGNGESVQFVFNGGVLTNEQIDKIKLEKKEIDAHLFVAVHDALSMLGPMAKRIIKRVEMAKKGIPFYYEIER
ncbi:MAG: NUDIX hydrolase [Candidatus Taylorbacteria bacterium]|nr:NUDIX hydrolase [Candidatus Taylorbacteria bacterium]